MLFETYAQSVELQNEYEETLVSKCYENQISSNACAFWLFHNTRNARYLGFSQYFNQETFRTLYLSTLCRLPVRSVGENEETLFFKTR